MIVLMLLACGGQESTGVWMEGSSYDWDFFNHRISLVEFGVSDTEAFATIVGGTSTTNLPAVLEPACDPDTCREFPFFDNADITVDWARATTKSAAFGSASASLTADADGETIELTVPLEVKGKGTPTVILRGYAIDTNEPLDGDPACYKPQNGWLPKSFAIELGTPVLSSDGLSVTVDVTSTFVAGVTNEPVRECLDAVVDRARVAVRADVLAVVTKGDAESIDVSHGMIYAYEDQNGELLDQPPPDLADRTLGTNIEDPLVGWSRFAFLFHEEGEDRGAYIRVLQMDIDLAGDVATGHATNHSPGTQLSGFDYLFAGTVQAVDVGAEIERGRISELIPVELDDAGAPVSVRWPL